MSSGPTPNFNLRLVGYLFLFTYLQASCRSSHLSKHLTCASRTYSQPRPVEIFSMLISRQVVGVFTCPNTSLVPPGPTPNLGLSRYSQCSSPGKLSEFSLVQTPHLCLQDSLPTSACRDILKHVTKTRRFRQSIDKSLSSNDLPANMPKKWNKTHYLNQEYSSSSMPLTLHQQCTNLVSTANP